MNSIQEVMTQIQRMQDNPKEASIGWGAEMNQGYQAGYASAAEEIMNMLMSLRPEAVDSHHLANVIEERIRQNGAYTYNQIWCNNPPPSGHDYYGRFKWAIMQTILNLADEGYLCISRND